MIGAAGLPAAPCRPRAVNVTMPARGTVVAPGRASLTIGTKLGVVVVPATLGKSWRMVRRQPKTCCEQICQRRATSDTRAPGTGVSATIRAFSSADQRRRRPGPVRTSTRRNALFASSLTSDLRIARSPVPQANQALPGRPLKKGFRAPLTVISAQILERQSEPQPQTIQARAAAQRLLDAPVPTE